MAKKDKSASLGKVGRVERERRYNALIQFGLIGVVVFVIVVLIGGAIWEGIIKPQQPVAVVGDQEILTKDFEVHARFARAELVYQYSYYYQIYQFLPDETQRQSYLNAMAQIQFSLDPALVGQRVMDQLIGDVLIRKEAEALNIEVSEEEIDEALATTFGYFPDGSPTPTITSTLIPTSTYSKTQSALVTYTPTITNTPTPVEDLETIPTQIITPTATIVSFSTSAPTETPPDQYEIYEADRENFLDLSGISLDDARSVIEARLYRQKVREAITADLLPEQEQIWIRRLLFEELSTAEDFLAKLGDGGNWNELAAEFFPEDPSVSQTGGDLGWASIDLFIPAISEAAVELKIGSTSAPIETENGWFVIQLIGHEMRPLDANAFENYKDSVFNEWLSNARSEIQGEVEFIDNWENRAPEDPRIPQPVGLQPGSVSGSQ